MVQRVIQVRQTVGRHKAVGRLHADQPTPCGGDTHAAALIGADRQIGLAGRDRGTGVEQSLDDERVFGGDDRGGAPPAVGRGNSRDRDAVLHRKRLPVQRTAVGAADLAEADERVAGILTFTRRAARIADPQRTLKLLQTA